MEDIAIKVHELSKSFKLPHEKQSSIKGLFIGLFTGKKSYEKQEVLRNINFDIKKGEFFGIVGRNGSGKSTLLKLLAGIYTPNKGAVIVNGSLTPFIELGVGFNPELTGQENVYLNGALLGFSRQEMKAMYDDIVSFAELHKFMDQKLKNYSSGMQVRLAFSIAIRAKSDILLLDEVLAVGDSAFQQKCFDFFESIKNENKTIIFVTHDMSAVKRFCTRAAYVVNGRVAKIGDPLDIATLYTEANIYNPENSNIQKSGDSLPNSKITARISKQTKKDVIIDFSFQTNREDKLYIGISVIREGISVADITTSLEKPLTLKGSLRYTLDTQHLNAGVYNITASLFKKDNRECIAICTDKIIFTLENEDITRGNALKLADTWEYNTK